MADKNPQAHAARFGAFQFFNFALAHFNVGALRINGKTWGEMTEEEHQRFPGDYEAQASQGPISLHSEEHLVTSDRGIMLQRKLLEKQIEVVAQGGDPVGVTFDAAQALVKVRSGNFYRAARAAG